MSHTLSAQTPNARIALAVAATALVTLLAAGSLLLTRDEATLAAVWAPNALATAWLLRHPRRDAGLLIAAVLAGSTLANVIAGSTSGRAIGLGLANALEVAIVWAGLARLGRPRPHMEHTGDLVAFCLLGGLVGPALAGTVSATVLAGLDEAGWSAAWFSWTVTDGLGQVLFAPVALILWDGWQGRRRPTRADVWRWCWIAAVGLAGTVAIFWQSRYPFLFLAAPIVLLHAFRIGAVAAALSVLATAVIATIATTHGTGPISLTHGDLPAHLFVLQVFLFACFVTGVPVAAALAGRARVEAELARERDFNATVLSQMREVLFRTDAQGRWEWLNPAWRVVSDEASEQCLGHAAVAHVHPDDRAAFAAALASPAGARFEARWPSADGDSRQVEISARAIVNADGARVGGVGSIRDITERHRAVTALRDSERLFETLARLSPVGIVRTDAAGALTYANPTWLALCGLTDDQARLGGWAEALHPEDRARVLGIWQEASSAGTDCAGEFRYLKSEGSVRWVHAIATPERDADGRVGGHVAVVVDVTERKALEHDLVRARRHAEAAVVAKSAFLANMSHEIRTPMNGVIGFTELLGASDLNAEQREHVRLIADSGRAMMRLLNDILDLSKVEADATVLAPQPTDLPHLLKNCVQLVTPAARAKGVALELAIDPALPVNIHADPLRLRQMIGNLMNNAVKFTDVGTVTLSARAADGRLAVAVADTGPGIAADRLEAVLRPFEQADASVAGRHGGTGLGLAITEKLARLMDGRLTLESTLGAGSVFTLTLPLTAATADRPVASPRPTPAPKRLSGRILLAEDHDVNQALITALLARLGLGADLAEDGEQAVSMVERARADGRPYDLVLMDLQMPRLDGLAATRRLRAGGVTAAELPIVALTANAFADDVAATAAAGLQDHLAKPLSPDTFARVLAKHLPPAEEEWAAPTGPERLRQLYDRRRAQTLDALARLLAPRGFAAADRDAVAGLLHRLAGTAAAFGEAELGERAGALEDRVRGSADGWTAEAHALLARAA